jgi:hypothetical protein
VFYDCLNQRITLWQGFLLMFWSCAIFCCKFCEILQTLILTWLAQSLKTIKGQLLRKPNFDKPSTPKPIDHNFKFLCDCHHYLLPPFMKAFIIEHIFTHLLIDLSMMWCFHQINQTWYKVVGDTMSWITFEIVKSNMSCHKTISILGIPKHFLKACLQFEVIKMFKILLANGWFVRFRWL